MGNTVFLAHISEDEREQTAQEHSRNAAKYASNAVAGAGISHAAYLAALLHDAGKFKQEFREYLLDAAVRKKSVKPGSVNHTFAGVRFVLQNWHGAGTFDYSEITAELLAYAIGAHHGLFDCVGEKQESGFLHRQTKDEIGYDESIGNFLRDCADQKELEELFRRAVEEVTPILEKIAGFSGQKDSEFVESEFCFYVGLLGRMLLSAVIEGDRRDTAVFMNGDVFPEWQADRERIWTECLERVERKLQELPSEKPIHKARKYISDCCAKFAVQPGGVCRLNVPTGGGKTLSGLRFALTHAKKWSKSRIIFTVPLLSILEQNAQVIRDYVADDSLILEHHSNLVNSESESERLGNLELLTETWEAPIIITTLVQLLNTIFSGKTGAVRRFHALCNSVIVIDEVQTVPNKMLTLFNLAVNFLSEICGATIVLCSATQPSLETVPHPLLQTPRDIVPWEQGLWDVFKRTQIQNAGCCRMEELPHLIGESLTDCGSLLVVCNTKGEAAYLFQTLSNADLQCFHLSAAMCPAHRRDALRALEAALDESRKGGRKVVCVSTQVIEAGVDISFQRVIRLAAGLDSVIQSAGRCNRHAESSTPAQVSIVQCMDEKLFGLEDIHRGKKATIALLEAFRKSPERFRGDLAGSEAIGFYYKQLYGGMDTGYQDDVVQDHGSIFDLLANNPKYADANCAVADAYCLRQAFQLAGRLFQVFDQDTTDVLVPYGKGRDIREELIAASRNYGGRDYARIRACIREVRPYCVSLYQERLTRLAQKGALIELFDGSVYALADGFYDNDTGFSLEKGTTDFWGV